MFGDVEIEGLPPAVFDDTETVQSSKYESPAPFLIYIPMLQPLQAGSIFPPGLQLNRL
jgi:hypothetical protein